MFDQVLIFAFKSLQVFHKINWMCAVFLSGNQCFMLWHSYILLSRYIERCVKHCSTSVVSGYEHFLPRSDVSTALLAGTFRTSSIKLTSRPASSLFRIILMTWIWRKEFPGTLSDICWEKSSTEEELQMILIRDYLTRSVRWVLLACLVCCWLCFYKYWSLCSLLPFAERWQRIICTG